MWLGGKSTIFFVSPAENSKPPSGATITSDRCLIHIRDAAHSESYVCPPHHQGGWHTTFCNTLQHIATHYNTLYHTATHYITHTASYCNTLQHAATRCNTLQHAATRCNTLQHTATHYIATQYTAIHYNTPQHTTTHCVTLQGTPCFEFDISDRLRFKLYMRG